MNIKTKFSLGDRVFIIQKQGKKEWIPCAACKGKGGVVVEYTQFTCTSCWGKNGRYGWSFEEWAVVYRNTEVGKVSIEKYSEEYYQQNPAYRDKEIKYMVTATGIGSGSIWYEQDIFKTLKEAEEECNKRNEEESKQREK
jgi:hypothetical protein